MFLLNSILMVLFFTLVCTSFRTSKLDGSKIVIMPRTTRITKKVTSTIQILVNDDEYDLKDAIINTNEDILYSKTHLLSNSLDIKYDDDYRYFK